MKKALFGRRAASAVIDLAAIYCLTILLQALVWQFTYVAFNVLFIVCFALYFSVTAGKSAGKLLAGIFVTSQRERSMPVAQIFSREVIFKTALGIVATLYFSRFLLPKYSVFSVILAYTILFIFSVLFLLLAKRSWWEMLSSTKTVKGAPQPAKQRNYVLLFLSVNTLAAIVVIVYPFVGQPAKLRNEWYPKYPVTQEVKQYASFIKGHAEDPADYLLHQFDTHDLVVFTERNHDEYSQYEVILKMVKDRKFIENVGNIFTECGSMSFQDTLNTYLHTRFDNEDQLNFATARLQLNSSSTWPLWDNTNLFDLLKTVNLLNAGLPDSLKVNWYFTAPPVDWNTMTHQKYIKAYTDMSYETVMAENVLNTYRNTILQQRRKKAFIIMNTRHGYGQLPASANKELQRNYTGTTAILQKVLCKKVANVMVHLMSIKTHLVLQPIQKGKWERAFEVANVQAAGFDFKGSPLGDDHLDLAFFDMPGTYKDLFTGLVFYKPFNQHIRRAGIPHEFTHFEDTLLKRASYVNPDYVDIVKRINSLHKEFPAQPSFTDSYPYAFLYNLIFTIGIPVLLMVVYLFGVILYFAGRRRKSVPALVPLGASQV